MKFGSRSKGKLMRHFYNTTDSKKSENGSFINVYVQMTAHKWFIKMIGTCKNDQSSIYAQARIK
jgi:hypothetical protein